jgi:hypothetical protein
MTVKLNDGTSMEDERTMPNWAYWHQAGGIDGWRSPAEVTMGCTAFSSVFPGSIV